MLLLTTKLHVPSRRAELVVRSRLLTQLNRVPTLPLAIISAPAGFGKTTLLAEWISTNTIFPNPLHFAYVALDDGDNEPARFWSYVCLALNSAHAGVGSGALSLLQAPTLPPMEAILTLLLNDLAALDDTLILILDDYHLIHEVKVHNSLQFLLAHLPPNVHLVLTTRSEPPLLLSQLRARDQLVELRAADLRFTTEEAAEFLRQVMHLDLTESDVAALEARTEGWIAGLQLAALSMQGRGDAKHFIASFSGSHRYIIEYLVSSRLVGAS